MIEITDREPSSEFHVLLDHRRQRLRNHLLKQVGPGRLLVRGNGDVKGMLVVLRDRLVMVLYCIVLY